MKINKKFLFIFVLCIFCGISIRYILKNNNDYSFDKLIDSLSQTQTLVVCPYDYKNPYNVCSGDSVIQSITDQQKVNEFISLITSSHQYTGVSSMPGPTKVVHALDENGDLILNIFVYPHVVIDKNNHSYPLTPDYQEQLNQIIF